MPKTGMEPQRRAELIDAAIAEIGAQGGLDVTVSAIARRAGLSSALAHHYFGTKEEIFLRAMRHILAQYGQEVRRRLARARTPRERLDAIVTASFDPMNFRAEVVSAWLNFYVHAQRNPAFARLLAVYHRRLDSTLRHALRPLVGPASAGMAETIAALIDGVYLRQSLSGSGPRPGEATRLLRGYLAATLGEDA